MAKKAAKRPIVEEVTTDFKSPDGQPYTYKLGQVTCIWGRSGTGKTARLNAIEAALKGAISDWDGRDETKDMSRIRTLGTFSHVKLSNGVTSKLDLEPKRLSTNTFPECFPLWGLRTVLVGSDDSKRKFLLERIVPPSMTREDIAKRFKTQEAGQTFLALTEGRTESPGDLLLRVIERSEKKVRSLKAQARDKDDYAKRRAEGLGPEPSAADVEDVQNALTEAAARAATAQPTGPLPDLTLLEQAARAAAAAYNTYKAEVTEIEQRVSEYPKNLPDRVARFQHLVAITEWHAEGTASMPEADVPCLVCGTERKHADYLKSHAVAIEKLQDYMAKAPDLALLQQAQSRKAQLRAEAERAIDAYQEAHERVQVALAHKPAEEDEGPTTEQLQTELRRLHNLQAAYSQIRAFQAEGAAAEKQAKGLVELRDAAKEVMTSVLDTAVEEFKARVQAYLPEIDSLGRPFTFELRVREGTKSVFEMGLLREGPEGPVVHVASGGYERAHLHLALGLALLELDTERGINIDGPAILVPEDRGVDPETLNDALTVIAETIKERKLDVQVLWLSTVKPKGRKPKGVTYVNTDPSATPSRKRSGASGSKNATKAEGSGPDKAAKAAGEAAAAVPTNGAGSKPVQLDLG